MFTGDNFEKNSVTMYALKNLRTKVVESPEKYRRYVITFAKNLWFHSLEPFFNYGYARKTDPVKKKSSARREL